MRSVFFLVLGTLLVQLAPGCSDDDDSDTPAGSSSTGDSSDDTSSSDASSSSSDAASSSSGAGAEGGGGAGGSGGGGGVGGTAGGGGTGGTCDYTAPNTCETAEPLMEIAGDEGTPSVVVTGQTSKFFQIKLLEGNSLPSTVEYKVTLESPQGMNYDVYVQQGSGDAPNCNIAADKGTGMPESTSDFFPDQVATDDSRYLGIEVRYLAGNACGAAAEWTLTVEGNVQ